MCGLEQDRSRKWAKKSRIGIRCLLSLTGELVLEREPFERLELRELFPPMSSSSVLSLQTKSSPLLGLSSLPLS